MKSGITTVMRPPSTLSGWTISRVGFWCQLSSPSLFSLATSTSSILPGPHFQVFFRLLWQFGARFTSFLGGDTHTSSTLFGTITLSRKILKVSERSSTDRLGSIKWRTNLSSTLLFSNACHSILGVYWSACHAWPPLCLWLSRSSTWPAWFDQQLTPCSIFLFCQVSLILAKFLTQKATQTCCRRSLRP